MPDRVVGQSRIHQRLCGIAMPAPVSTKIDDDRPTQRIDIGAQGLLGGVGLGHMPRLSGVVCESDARYMGLHRHDAVLHRCLGFILFAAQNHLAVTRLQNKGVLIFVVLSIVRTEFSVILMTLRLIIANKVIAMMISSNVKPASLEANIELYLFIIVR